MDYRMVGSTATPVFGLLLISQRQLFSQKSHIVKKKSSGPLDGVTSFAWLPRSASRLSRADARRGRCRLSGYILDVYPVRKVSVLWREATVSQVNKLTVTEVGGRTASTILNFLFHCMDFPVPSPQQAQKCFPTLRLPFLESNLRSHSDKHWVIGGWDYEGHLPARQSGEEEGSRGPGYSC